MVKESCIRGLPPYTWPRRVMRGPFVEEPQVMVRKNLLVEEPQVRVQENLRRGISPLQIGEYIYIGRGFQGRIVNVGTSPTLIQASQYTWPYLILNPSRSVGLTTFGDIANLTTAVAGNSQSSPVGVANYLSARFFLEVYANAGTWDFYAQTMNPMTSTWIDSQVLFGSVAGIGNFYASLGGFGSDTDLAVRWVPTVAGDITFRLSYILKEGTIGSGSGVAQTVYVGSDNSVKVGFGFPILEGEHFNFLLEENVELWGIAETDVELRVFTL